MGSPYDPDTLPERSRRTPKGHDVGALGPSDSSDTGADVAGADLPGGLDSTSDRHGTGERANADRQPPAHAGTDIEPDRVVDADFDEAERAWLESDRGLH